MKSIFIFYPICVTAEFEVRIQTAQEMSDGGSYNQILINKLVKQVYSCIILGYFAATDKRQNRVICIRGPAGFGRCERIEGRHWATGSKR